MYLAIISPCCEKKRKAGATQVAPTITRDRYSQPKKIIKDNNSLPHLSDMQRNNRHRNSGQTSNCKSNRRPPNYNRLQS